MQIWAALIGLIGVGLGAIAAWRAQIAAGKWNLLLELHREFNSEAMIISRSKALEFLKENPNKTFSEIDDVSVLDRDALPLWKVMRFYDRLGLVAKHKQVERKRVRDLFGEVFVWWYSARLL